MLRRPAPRAVYGTVYSGLDLGFCLSAPVFGAMLDHGMTSGIFFGSAATLALSVVSAALVGGGSRRGWRASGGDRWVRGLAFGAFGPILSRRWLIWGSQFGQGSVIATLITDDCLKRNPAITYLLSKPAYRLPSLTRSAQL